MPKLLPKYRVVTDKWIYKVAGSTAAAIGRPDVTVQQSRTVAVATATTVASSQSNV